MIWRLAVCVLSFSCSLRAAEPTKQEERLRTLVHETSAGVVLVVAGHDSYPQPVHDSEFPGRLGGYTPQPILRSTDRGKVDRPDPLDLGDPRNTADHPFGTGIVLDAKDGLILVPYHLVDGATKIYVRGAGKGSYADIHAADGRSDLAVIRTLSPLDGLKALPFADVRLGKNPTLEAGTPLFSLGYPLAAGFVEEGPSASQGILANVVRRTPSSIDEEQRKKPLTQFCKLLHAESRLASTSPGAPLLNLKGELVGMTNPIVAVAATESVGSFAIPFDAGFRRIIEKLRAGEEVEYGFLGVSISPTAGKGVVVTGVTPNTPADRAGISGVGRTPTGGAGGDVLEEVDGIRLETVDDLFLNVGTALAGRKATIKFSRGGRSSTVQVELLKYAHDFPTIASNRPRPVFGLRVDYVSVIAARDPSRPLPQGVVMREVEANSTIAEKLKVLLPEAKGKTPTREQLERFLVTHVDDKPIEDPRSFVTMTRGKKALELRIVDRGANDKDFRLELP